MDDLISRQAAIDALGDEPEVWTGKDEYEQGLNNQWHYDRNAIKALPSAQPTLYGYDIETLKAIANTLTAKGLTPEAYADLINDTGRVVQMVLEEQREIFAEDLISRQAAIDAIERNAYRHTYLDQIIDIIQNMPPAELDLRNYTKIVWNLAYEAGVFQQKAEIEGEDDAHD